MKKLLLVLILVGMSAGLNGVQSGGVSSAQRDDVDCSQLKKSISELDAKIDETMAKESTSVQKSKLSILKKRRKTKVTQYNALNCGA